MSELEEERNHGRIIPINIEDEMKTAYIDYSMSVIVSRAIPDVRDGFKPVHRRVMYGMHELGNHHNKPYKKSARIVGEVLGKYHPHGDTAVYDSMVRMAQEWSLRYPMVDGQGNYGSVDGDPPAAMRYTEARMSKIAEEMLSDLEKETVDFQNNFDDTLKEPTVMPARIPNLLVNGTSGIAVGMATNMLPHNLTEAIEGCIAYIDNRDITVDELMEFVKAPDFPTGGTIYGIEGVREAFRTGRGKVVVRGKAEIENEGNRENIVITEIPYQVNKAKLHVQISELVNEGKIEGISDVRDESDRTGMRLVVELRRDAIPNVVLNRLFQYSQLQTSFGVNNIALVKGRPEMLNLKDMIHHFVEFRHEIVVRRTKFELAEAEKRAHILEGLIIAVNNIDEVIKIIRQSETSQIAQETLMSRFELSEIQTKAILEMRLRALTGLEIEKLRKEYEDIMALITHLKNILSDETLRYTIIKDELTEIKTKYGDKRKTDITFASGEINILDLIDNEQVVVTITHLGYMKRTSLAEYKEQSRGGKGSKGSNSREEDFIEHMFVAHTHNVLLLFTRNGRCHWLNVYEVPEGNKTSKGRAIQNILNISSEDKILAYIPIQNLSDEEYINNNYVMFCTKNGVIKKTLLEEFSRPRTNGITALTIREGDELLEVVLTNGKMEVVLASLDGRALRFNESKIRSMGRSAAGVTGMDLGEINENNAIVGMVCVDKDSEEKQTILVVSEKGFGKRTYLDDPEDGEPIYRITNRGGKGVKTLNVTEKTGKVIAIKNVVDGDHLMIINKSGLAIRLKVSALRVIGRAAQGVTLIKLKGKDAIAAVAKVAAGDDDEDELAEGMEGDVNNIDNALQGGEEPEEFIDEPEIEETEDDSEEPGDDAGDE